jgi:hypothetical protein
VQILVALMALVQDPATAAKQLDPIKQLVLELLVSYGGIAAGAAILSEGFSKIFPKVVGKENRWTFILTFVLGLPAKYLFPTVYGHDGTRSWVFHSVVLLFVAVSAAVMRERLVQKFAGFFGGIFSKGSGGAPLDEGGKPTTKILPPQDQGDGAK